MTTAKNDITKVNNGLVKEVEKLIENDLSNAGLHLLELKKALAMVKSDTFVTDTAIKIKEKYLKASKDLNAPSTFKKYSMRWGRLVSVEKRNEVRELLNDVSDVNGLSMSEVDTLLGGNTATRGGGRPSSVKEPKEPKDTQSTESDVASSETTVKVKKEMKEAQAIVDRTVTNRSVLDSLSTLLTMDSDSIAFKVSQLSDDDLILLSNALSLLK